MAGLYRVFPFHPDSPPTGPGGPLYIPPQGSGRIDNPNLYAVLYLSDAEAGAIAEAFGRFPEWTPAMLAGAPALPGSVRALARYRLNEGAAICDLDDAPRLVSLGLRPSQIVTRDYTQTRAWARSIYEQGLWAGVRWWSYYDPQWGSIGLWRTGELEVEEVRVLRLDDPALIEASHAIVRRIVVPRPECSRPRRESPKRRGRR